MLPAYAAYGQKIAILGLGRSGRATAKAVQAGGGQALCWDDGTEARENAAQAGLPLVELTKRHTLSGVDRLIISPGIAHLYPTPHPIIHKAIELGIPLDNDIGLFFESLEKASSESTPSPKIIAVTGSNGKSTTAALIHHLLVNAQKTACLGGNIGRAVFEMPLPKADGFVVLELSSYQIELARSLRPNIAVFTNFSVDHLDRHGGRGGYFSAKERLFSQGQPQCAIIGIDETEGKFLSNRQALSPKNLHTIQVSSRAELTDAGWNFFIQNGSVIEYRNEKKIASWDLRNITALPGAHNHQNAAASVATLRSLDVAPRLLESGLQNFKSLAHRCQLVAEGKGLRFINDSKATNVASASTALQAFSNIHWIAGGQAKEGGLDGIGPYLKNVKAAYLIGDAAKEFSKQLGARPNTICETLQNAITAAVAQAQSGDTILLAPAASSHDQFTDFEHRGECFAKLAKAAIK